MGAHASILAFGPCIGTHQLSRSAHAHIGRAGTGRHALRTKRVAEGDRIVVGCRASVDCGGTREQAVVELVVGRVRRVDIDADGRTVGLF